MVRRVVVRSAPIRGRERYTLLQIEIAEEILAPYEWVEDDHPYREWIVPAAVLNEARQVKIADPWLAAMPDFKSR